jgi:sugar transferase (PEP-CTERM/EpsH1 system associated)
MNVLMLCGEIPYPPHGGSRMRVYQFIRMMAQRHRITLLACQYADDEYAHSAVLGALCQVVAVRWQEPAALARMRVAGTLAAQLAYGRTLLLDSDPWVAQFFRLPALKARLRDLLAREPFDLMHVEDTAMMAVLPAELNVPVVLSIQNVESWRAARAEPAGLGQRIEVWKLRRYERSAFERAAVCCPASALEAEQVQRLAPTARVQIVANGVDTAEFGPAGVKSDSPTLIFTGTLSYAPNAEGIGWFVRDIWPLILAAVPGVKLDIVGREPPAEVLALASDRVHVCGDVPDVRPYLQCAWLAIVPVLHGGGTRLKILEAMACALPVVSTTIGAEGLDVVDGRDILIADEPATFAAHVVELLRDTLLRVTLGQFARALVERHYEWRVITEALETAYQLALRT